MAKLSRWLLSLLLLCTCHSAASGQTDSCSYEQWRNNVMRYLFRNYDYPGTAWQQYCDSALTICPKYDYLWQMKAMPSIKNGIYEVAFGSLGEAIKINPEKQYPYQAFLKCTFAKDYTGALEDFERSEQLVQSGGIMDHSFSFYRGLCYLGLENPRKAIAEFSRDVAEQTRSRGAGNEHYNSLFYLGLSYWLNAEADTAELYWNACLKAYSRFPEPNFYMGMLYLGRGRKEKAREYLLKAREYLLQGATMNEDNNFYVDYPYQVGLSDIEKEVSAL